MKGCNDCRFYNRELDEYPCCECMRSYIDRFEARGTEEWVEDLVYHLSLISASKAYEDCEILGIEINPSPSITFTKLPDTNRNHPVEVKVNDGIFEKRYKGVTIRGLRV